MILKKKNERNTRPFKVSEIIRKAISEILIRNELPIDPPFKFPVNVTKVLMNGDLKVAYIYILSNEKTNRKNLIEKLNFCKKFLSKEVSKMINLKFSPKLVFKYDESFEKVHAIEELLNSEKIKKNYTI